MVMAETLDRYRLMQVSVTLTRFKRLVKYAASYFDPPRGGWDNFIRKPHVMASTEKLRNATPWDVPKSCYHNCRIY
jgi:hypothetical protein